MRWVIKDLAQQVSRGGGLSEASSALTAMSTSIFSAENPKASSKALYGFISSNLTHMARSLAATHGRFSDTDLVKVGHPVYSTQGLELDAYYRDGEIKHFVVSFGRRSLSIAEQNWATSSMKRPVILPYTNPSRILSTLFQRIVLGSSARSRLMTQVRNPQALQALNRVATKGSFYDLGESRGIGSCQSHTSQRGDGERFTG